MQHFSVGFYYDKTYIYNLPFYEILFSHKEEWNFVIWKW
jgi:hypothetical protein